MERRDAVVFIYKADRSHDRSAGGNDLGLSLVNKIVDLHGGSVSAESEIGKGTTFIVTI
jgi:two-component system, OmpR family, phosphate regulon sensor histidine kinase PhoR